MGLTSYLQKNRLAYEPYLWLANCCFAMIAQGSSSFCGISIPSWNGRTRAMSDPHDKIRHEMAFCNLLKNWLGLRASVTECLCWTEWTDNQIRASLEMAVSV